MTAVAAGDADRVRSLLAADPSLASARGDDGVSALLLARYRFDRPVMDALAGGGPGSRRVRGGGARLRSTGCVRGSSTTRMPPRRSRPMASRPCTSRRSSASPRSARILIDAGARVDVVHDERVRQPAAPCGGGRARRRSLPGAAGGRCRCRCHPARRVTRRSTRRPSTATSRWSSCSCRPVPTRRPRRRRRPPGGPRRSGRPSRSGGPATERRGRPSDGTVGGRRSDLRTTPARRGPGEDGFATGKSERGIELTRVSRAPGSARGPTDGPPSRRSPARRARR